MIFFFSSRRRHTRYWRDWSSDVCSSDLSDGYQVTQMDQFHTHVQNFLTRLRTTPPYPGLFCGINVYRVDVASTDSGADDPADCDGGTGAMARTYFDATFCSVGPGGRRYARLLTVNQALADRKSTR